MSPHLLAAILVSFLLVPAAFADDKDPSGTYRCDGKNPNGSSYQGKVTIKKLGSGFQLDWAIGSGTQTGVGLLSDGRLSVAWRAGESGYGGVAVYIVREDGTLDGRWVDNDDGAKGSEMLTPK